MMSAYFLFPFLQLASVVERPLAVQTSPGERLLIQMDNRTLGIAWSNQLPASQYIQRQNMMNGAGVALGDFDGDGRCDVFLCNKFGSSALYRNLGNWQFEDVTARAGVALASQVSNGAVFADADGDGKLDLFVTSFYGPHSYFRNLGDGTFTNLTQQSGLSSSGGATSQALADLDGDGDLDLYVNYFAVEALLRDGVAFSTRIVQGRPVVTGRYSKRLQIIGGNITELGEPDIIYRNDGGKFTPLKWEEFFRDETGRPIPSLRDFGLAVQIRDINLDGYPDIYTCNDFQTPDRVWLNDGKGRFRAIAPLALRNHSYASMGVDFADLNRDGHLDFITVEMLSRDRARHLRQSSPMSPTARAIGEIEKREDVARNGLYINRGDGTYAELAWFSGVAASDWSWTPIFLDVDLDGYEDLLISNGHLHDVNDRDHAQRTAHLTSEGKREMFRNQPRLNPANVAYRNRGDLTFEEVSDTWGFNSTQITHGMALADLDQDGDLDIVANGVNGGPLFYKNNSAAPRVAVRLRGRAPNTQGIGARIALTGGGMVQMQEIVSGGRYLSGDDALRVFAAKTNSPMSLEVTWRDGRRTQIPHVKSNTLYEIDESSSVPASRPAEIAALQPWFEDVSARLDHTHKEQPFDDFERQPLLPRRFSQLGPGLAWFDWNGDGADDLIIGAGRGDQLAGFLNDGAGNFTRFNVSDKPLADDSAGIVGIVAEGRPAILAAIAHYEAGQPGPPIQFFSAGKTQPIASPLADYSSPGPLAVADIDGDGDLDLFVGGRIIPGNYPTPTSGAIYRNENGAFVKDEISSALILPDGMITAAVFSDLDGDGFPELITAEEWGPIRIHDNTRGQLTGRREPDGRHGWWNSVTTGDMNNDGRLDIIAGNWGRNSHYQRGQDAAQWSIFYGELEAGAQGELIETYRERDRSIAPVRDLPALSAVMPSLKNNFPTHTAFASANLETALAERLAASKSVTASTFESTLYINEGTNGFRPRGLPAEAQWAPAFGLNVFDFDNDGTNDLFVAQNNFAVRPEDDRQDAGRGLLLRGTAGGELLPIPGQASGLLVYGEQRGSAVADFDGDGRVDLAVTQNGAATKLFRNASAPPGLRVRLQGPGQNPFGYGAVLRARTPAGWGSAREIHGGSGYWSQDSAVQVFPGNITELNIRWPGGQEATSSIPAGVREITIDTLGASSVLK